MGTPALQSPVLAALHALYSHHPRTQWSWTRLNHALQQQLLCLILVGAVFKRDDFCTLAADRRLAFGYWSGEDHGERFYSTAVASQNRSACQAFEHWKQRLPYIWQGKRLCLGDQVQWQGEAVQLTSFAVDGASITLCSYRPPPQGTACLTCGTYQEPYAERKILHRYKVTLEQLHDADLTRHAVKRTQKQAADAAAGGGPV